MAHVRCLWCWLSMLWAVCLLLTLIPSSSEAAIYHHSGKCKNKDKLFKVGQTFTNGCDKCYCHEMGFTCFTPMKPTSWPKKCMRIPVDCGYRIVYRENPEKECRAYSWIG
ncbi:beta-microseminoprotein-like [Polyodon spathula]|uniref:beta-microseminoprotein-like n=1 Tax=Polyodon spathula TaxID=7913 RepID=UPI001B7F224C|nr:beta-microseminoprotein-like [Polyodon spathula]